MVWIELVSFGTESVCSEVEEYEKGDDDDDDGDDANDDDGDDDDGNVDTLVDETCSVDG